MLLIGVLSFLAFVTAVAVLLQSERRKNKRAELISLVSLIEQPHGHPGTSMTVETPLFDDPSEYEEYIRRRDLAG